MSTSVTTIITNAANGYGNITTAEGVIYLNMIHRMVLTAIPIYKTTEDLSSLVAGTSEYALNEATVKVFAAEYRSSSSADPQPLEGIQVSELDERRRAWRRDERGVPKEFYLDRNTTDQIIGFLPWPDTTSSGGYPLIRLYVSRTQTLTSGDSLPKGLASDDTYLFGIRWRHALDRRPEVAEYWHSMFMAAFEFEEKQWFARNARARPSIFPAWPMGSGVK